MARRVKPDSSLDLEVESPRSQIIAAARRLFFSTGFKSATMDELAASLGMSKKTLYQQFAGKDELLRSVIHCKFDEIESELGLILAQKNRTVPELLTEMLTCFQRQISEIQPAFVRDVERSDPGLFAMIDERRQIVIRKYVGSLLAKGRRTGMVRRDIPAAMLMDIFMAGARTIVTPARLVEHNLSPQKAFSQVLEVFLNGILTDRDRP